MLDEQFGYAGWERGREREREGKDRERERGIEKEAGKGEKEREAIVWLCWLSSLGMLVERDIGKEEEREGEETAMLLL
jgi:hypothetical protein